MTSRRIDPIYFQNVSNTFQWSFIKGLEENNISFDIISAPSLPCWPIRYKIKTNIWLESDVGKIIYCKTKFQALPFRALFETIKKVFIVDVVHYSSAYYCLTIYRELNLQDKVKFIGEVFGVLIRLQNQKKIC